jgi:hypothetical protein
LKLAKHPAIKFLIGKVAGIMKDSGWFNRRGVSFLKKTSAEAYANLILQREGHVYIKVKYGNDCSNDCIADTKKEIREAFAQFTERNLINFYLKTK